MKSMRYISSVLFVLSLILVSCNEDESGMNKAPQITINDASNIYRVGATLSATITNSEGRDIKESGFIYSTSSDFENMSMEDIRKSSICKVVATSEPVTSGRIEQAIAALTPNTTYHYCAYVSSGYSVSRSELKSFTTTSESEIMFSPLTVSDVTINSCRMEFSLLDIGGEDKIQTLQIWYKSYTGAAPTVLKADECERPDASNYSVTLPGLQSGVHYAACIYATTTGGRTTTGPVVTFTTESINVTFGAATVTPGDTYFSVACTVTTSEEVVSEGIFYSTETHNPTEINLIEADNNVNKSINVTVSDLKAGTYYIRPYVQVRKNGNLFYVNGNTTPVDITGYIEPDAQLSPVTIDNVTSSSITVSCAFSGTSTGKEHGFCYVKGTGTPTINDNTITISSGKPFTATLYALDSDTDYTIRAYAVTDSGVSYSDPKTQHTNKKTPSSDDNVFPGM